MPLGFIMASSSPLIICYSLSIIYDYADLDLSAFSRLRSIRKHLSASSAIVLALSCPSILRMFSTFSVFIIPKVLICLLPLRHLRSGTLRPLTTEWPSSPNLVQVGRHLVAPYSATFLVKTASDQNTGRLSAPRYSVLVGFLISLQLSDIILE